MNEYLEKAFSDFLETQEADKIFDSFQTAIKQAFVEGFMAGQKIDVKIVYIKIKK